MAKSSPPTTRKYSNRFKATALQLSQLPGVEVQEVAQSLCIPPFILSKCRKEAPEGIIVTEGIQLDKQTSAELKELRKIKKDYERLKIEHELFKKKQSSSLPNEKRHLRFHPRAQRNSIGELHVCTVQRHSAGRLTVVPGYTLTLFGRMNALDEGELNESCVKMAFVLFQRSFIEDCRGWTGTTHACLARSTT